MEIIWYVVGHLLPLSFHSWGNRRWCERVGRERVPWVKNDEIRRGNPLSPPLSRSFPLLSSVSFLNLLLLHPSGSGAEWRTGVRHERRNDTERQEPGAVSRCHLPSPCLRRSPFGSTSRPLRGEWLRNEGMSQGSGKWCGPLPFPCHLRSAGMNVVNGERSGPGKGHRCQVLTRCSHYCLVPSVSLPLRALTSIGLVPVA